MTESKKPFLSIAAEVDDDAIEAIARKKGVPVLTTNVAAPRASVPEPGGQGAVITPSMEPPRPQLSYIKAAIPDYALTDLKTRALQDEVTVNHLILKALTGLGIAIRPEHMVEDGRRLRGRNAVR
jgi:hypothetical protein